MKLNISLALVCTAALTPAIVAIPGGGGNRVDDSPQVGTVLPANLQKVRDMHQRAIDEFTPMKLLLESRHLETLEVNDYDKEFFFTGKAMIMGLLHSFFRCHQEAIFVVEQERRDPKADCGETYLAGWPKVRRCAASDGWLDFMLDLPKTS